MKLYYCYIEQGEPIIVEDEPDDFKEFAFNRVVNVPNLETAKKAYNLHLKYRKRDDKWLKNQKEN